MKEALEPPEDAPRLVRLNRALALHSACTEAVIRATDERALLEDVCRIIVDVSGYRMAWVGYAEHDARKTIRPVAYAGIEAGYLESVDIRWDDHPRGQGPCGTAIRTGKPSLIRNVHEDPSFAPWRAEAARRGYASCVGLPLRSGGQTLGGLMIYAAAVDAFDGEEVDLMARLSANLAYGMASLRSEGQRREAESRLRALYRASPDLIILHARDGRIVDANDNALARFGQTREGLLSLRPEELIHPDHTLEEAFALTGRAMAGEAVDFEWMSRGRLDDFPSEVRLRRLEDVSSDDPDAPCVLAVVRDITERKRADAERLRTQKLESLGLMAGGIAHDFNNLLTGILGNISLAGAREADAGVVELLQEAEGACLRAQALTRQLLTFAKGGSPLRRPLEPGALALEAVRFALRGSRLELAADLEAELWPVSGDRDQLFHAVHNLAINAVQAVGGPGRLELAACNVTLTEATPLPLPRGRYVRLTVGDDGPGIPAPLLTRIFDPYFTTKERGTGLGLATTFAVVKSHGGHVTVTSRPGEGARFEVWLPAGDAAVLPAPREVLAAPARLGRVLVMDDDPAVRSTAEAILTTLGHEVGAADSGETAVTEWTRARAEGRPFDLLFLDVTVPGGLGGHEALARILALDPTVKAIATSGYTEEGILANHEAHGFCGALPKPYRLRDLQDEIQRVLTLPPRAPGR